MYNTTEVIINLESGHLWIASEVPVDSLCEGNNILILLEQHFFVNLVCKETLKTKSTFVREEIIRAEINASIYSKWPTSFLFKRAPAEFISDLAFEGYCTFSINNPLNLLKGLSHG